MSSAAEFKQRNVGAAYRPDWATPPDLFAKYDEEFYFTLDAAARHDNAKCARYLGPLDDALTYDKLDWREEVVWLNPPYDASLARWVERASYWASKGATVCCLIPAHTDTRWWHKYVEGRAEVRFIKGRIRFVGAPYNAPFPSCLIVFRPEAP